MIENGKIELVGANLRAASGKRYELTCIGFKIKARAVSFSQKSRYDGRG